jgi:uncharacterized repeat protein (TIGR03803 family)
LNKGEGDIFKLSSTGIYTVLHQFIANTTDGFFPTSSLLRDSLGNLYGTTEYGGNYSCTRGCGVVFKVTASGVEKIMHTFAGAPNDGANPYAGLIRDHAGNFYGTTVIGGPTNLGTVFKIDTTGKETVLYSFQGITDGANPQGSLLIDATGNLYGTTSAGGTMNATFCPSGCGTVFKLDASGNETIIHSSEGFPDGTTPVTGMILGSDGNFYGTTVDGGTSNTGTIFKITP